MFTIKMSLSLNTVISSLKAANFVMINHRACEQLILFYNNLKMISLEQAKLNYCKMCAQFLTWFLISLILSGKGPLFHMVIALWS